jgi:hypothetical protein
MSSSVWSVAALGLILRMTMSCRRLTVGYAWVAVRTSDAALRVNEQIALSMSSGSMGLMVVISSVYFWIQPESRVYPKPGANFRYRSN